MEHEFSMKELYDVFLKTTYPIEIAGKQLEAGETLCVFDKVQISNFNEIKNRITAHGGFADRDHVFWEDTRGIDITLSQGIFNTLQFGLLCNAKMIYQKEGGVIKISKQEEVESNEQGIIIFSEEPVDEFFIYNEKTGEKITDYKVIDGKNVLIDKPYTLVILNYKYIYSGGSQILTVGRRMIEGFLRLEGKTRVKDDISGKVRTGIFEVPKLKLMSDLSMRLGKNANPVVGNFSFRALPDDKGPNAKVMNLYFLNDDIDSDM